MTAKHPERTAQVTPAYGYRQVGGYGIRGWRVHCPRCGYLSDVYRNNGTCRGARDRHVCEETAEP